MNEQPLFAEPVFDPVIVLPANVAELCVQVTVTLMPAKLGMGVNSADRLLHREAASR